MIITTAISLYVADKILSQFIKEEGYGGLKRFFFPTVKYKNRLSLIISTTISEYEIRHPDKAPVNKLFFFQTQVLLDQLLRHILFKKDNPQLLVAEFKNNSNIIIPTEDQLKEFYELFINNVNSDKILKSLHFSESYQGEIFEISKSLERLGQINEKILSRVDDIDKQVKAANDQITQLRNRFDLPLEVKSAQRILGLVVHPQLEKLYQTFIKILMMRF